ncbi:hypothetical protein NBRC111894_441 [Sporolactobacillus inulinus]|uniref:Uncharacterized protein n=1 Tax=Sporolactobacillus inulinus TaxID=2078 RepID=A0A4Y1Z753_9BACL|nr:hypothetical protein [Sporolactobacillus inulinus]GAY74887.1 hypothetical protein NBRC111894_441 [Sporolactobacillus inulinus]
MKRGDQAKDHTVQCQYGRSDLPGFAPGVAGIGGLSTRGGCFLFY